MPKIARKEPWQHRFVEANGLRFHVVTQGPAGPGASRGLVVLLHGFAADKSHWARVARYLTPHLRVIAPDLPGHGAEVSEVALAHPDRGVIVLNGDGCTLMRPPDKLLPQ